MSKSSTPSNSKPPPRLPSKSAWARGPPPRATSRSQSPAPSNPTTSNTPGPAVHGNHSRRPRGQGISIKDGVSIPRNATTAAKAGGSGITFSLIDNAGAPMHSSPATAPAVKNGDVIESGSLPVNGEAVKSGITGRPQTPLASSTTTPSMASTPATTTPTSTPSPAPKLFQGAVVSAPDHASVSSSAGSTASPVIRPSNLLHANALRFVPPPSTPEGLRTGSDASPQYARGTSPRPIPGTSNGSRLNAAAGAFVPRKTISPKTADGKPVDLDSLRRKLNVDSSPASATSQSPSVDMIHHTISASRPVVRMETSEQKWARKTAEGEKAKQEHEAKANEEQAKKEAGEEEREKGLKKMVEEMIVREQEKVNREAKAAKKEGGDEDEDEDEIVAKVEAEQDAEGRSARSASTSAAVMPRAGSPPLSRDVNQGGPGGNRRRARSSRGHARDNNRQSTTYRPPSNMQPPLERVAPLKATANRWTPATMKAGANVEMSSPEIVDQKVKALLNNLTMERFDSISDKIIEWANRSERERDGRTLIQVTRLVFERATGEERLSEMYARLCRKMMEQISTKVQDDEIINSEGKPFAGGLLFRKYLLNRCQDEFERRWGANDTAAAVMKEATIKAKEIDEGGDKGDEFGLYADEHYAAEAKRRGLGLIRFIGELFKLQMFTEKHIHGCIKNLLGNNENPEEEQIASLCKLLTTVGSIIDTPKARAHMDVYFSRMKEFAKSKNVNSLMTFMLQDVIELRSNNWWPRDKVAVPTTHSQIHWQAAKEKNVAMTPPRSNMSHGNWRRRDNRNEGPVIGPDSWAIADSEPGALYAPPKVGDLSNFGKLGKQHQYHRAVENPVLPVDTLRVSAPSTLPELDFKQVQEPQWYECI